MTMIVVYLDSFDYPASAGAASVAALALRGWSASAGFSNITVTTTSPITGTASLDLSASNTARYIQRTIPGTPQSLSLRLRVRITRSNANGEDFIQLYEGATRQLYVEATNSNGDLAVLRGDGTTLVTAIGALPDDGEHDIELVFKIANTGGFAKLYVDGVQVGSTFSGDTQNSANAYVDLLRLGDSGTQVFLWVLDDLRIYKDDAAGDAVQMGPSRVYVKRPTGDTSQEDWAKSAGADSYAMVDEATSDDDGTYLESSTDAHKTRLTGGSVDGTVGVVKGWQVVAVARKTDGNSRDLLPGVTDAGGTSESKSAAQALTSAYLAYYHSGIDVPGGSGLTPTNITDMELLVEANQ